MMTMTTTKRMMLPSKKMVDGRTASEMWVKVTTISEDAHNVSFADVALRTWKISQPSRESVALPPCDVKCTRPDSGASVSLIPLRTSYYAISQPNKNVLSLQILY